MSVGAGASPETSPAQCEINRPHGVFVDKKGVAFLGASEAQRVRLLAR